MSHKNWAHGERMIYAATAYPNGLDGALNDGPKQVLDVKF